MASTDVRRSRLIKTRKNSSTTNPAIFGKRCCSELGLGQDNVSREQAASFNYLGGYFKKGLPWKGYREVMLHKERHSVDVLLRCWGRGGGQKEDLISPAKEFSRPDVSRPWHHRMELRWLHGLSACGLERIRNNVPSEESLGPAGGIQGAHFPSGCQSLPTPVSSELTANTDKPPLCAYVGAVSQDESTKPSPNTTRRRWRIAVSFQNSL